MLSNAASAQELRLADHVRACRIDEQVILLDLKRNKYLGVDSRRSVSLASLVVGWPTGDGRLPPSPPSGQGPETSSLLKTLAGKAMLVNACEAPRSPSHIDEPLESWISSSTEKPPAVGPRDMLQLACSAAGAACWLRWRSLAQIETSVMRLRRQAPRHPPTRSEELDWQVSRYMRLRPFFFTARDRCLHDSLSLIRFLGARALFPQWVIGVRTRPFAAHSWVQSGPLVLNDLHEHVRAFRPILVV